MSLYRTYGLAFLGLALFTGFFVLSALELLPNQGKKKGELIAVEGATMGTYYRVSVVNAPENVDAVSLQHDVEALFNEVIDDMSNYHAHSTLSEFNRQPIQEPFAISADTAEVIQESLRLGELTDAALDITATPLIRLWGFEQSTYRDVMPEPEAIAAAKAKMGLQHLHLMTTENGVFLQKDIPDLVIDVSAIGKGFSVDKVARHLDALSIENYLIEVGGELRARGINSEYQPWRIAVERPSVERAAAQEFLQVHNNSIATSGNYRQSYELDGKTISHILDPRTGVPVESTVASITVIHPSCMTADGLATAFMVMGAEKALAYAAEHDIAVFLVSHSEDGFIEQFSPAFQQYQVKS